ncbi:hypothetical protein J3A83DRAFT_13608 [Scleroderma citrinum]
MRTSIMLPMVGWFYRVAIGAVRHGPKCEHSHISTIQFSCLTSLGKRGIRMNCSLRSFTHLLSVPLKLLQECRRPTQTHKPFSH